MSTRIETVITPITHCGGKEKLHRTLKMDAELNNSPLYFFKYQGAGNDFIFIDNRENIWKKLSLEYSVSRLCDRRYGIGADGVILIQNHHDFDFQMVYFNSDGSEAEMCGNGARCAVAIAKQLGIIKNKAVFLAKDGTHEGLIDPDNNLVEIKMVDVVEKIEVEADGSCVLNTGVPHYVRFVCDLSKINIVSEARKIRFSEKFKDKGINVNFVSSENLVEQQTPLTQDNVTRNNVTQNDRHIKVFTYERGVEDETFACGTGATASALAVFFCKKKKEHTLSVDEIGVSIVVSVKGGDLIVSFDYVNSTFTNVFLRGPAKFVFEGKLR